MKKLVYASIVVLMSFAYLDLPAALLSYAPFKYESATFYFDRAPKDALESLRVPHQLKDEILVLQCKAAQADEGEESRPVAARLSCVLVSKRSYQDGLIGVFLQQPGWSFPSLTTRLKAGAALWPSVVPFPFAQVGLQILLALILARTALRGELNRFVKAFQGPAQLVWLLPAGILASRMLLITILSAEHQFAFFRDCDVDRLGYGALVHLLLVAPIAEELLFRGWAYAFLERVYSTRWVVIITSVVFAAMHYEYAIAAANWMQSVPNALFYVCMGLALGYVRYRTGSVIMCVGAHFLSNLLATLTRLC